jgi:RNA polymerase sigma-70 factor (ECF subfamily)
VPIPESRRILQAISELPEDEREAFDLVRVQGTTHTEAAQVLGISALTVKQRLNRGLQLLTEQLADLHRCQEPANSS